MFVLSLLEDTLLLEPEEQTSHNYEKQLRSALERKYINKVIPNCGLVIALHALRHVEAPVITLGEGTAHCKVEFTLLVFRPFPGEVMEGDLLGSDETGLRVTLGFFEDVFLPSTSLREPRGYRAEVQRWWWQFDEHKLEYGPLHCPVRFRVRDVRYTQPGGEPPGVLSRGKAAFDGRASNKDSLPLDYGISRPMIVLGSVDEDGLGMKAWWQ